MSFFFSLEAKRIVQPLVLLLFLTSFCTGLKNLHDDDEEVIIVDDIVDVVLLSPALRLKCKRMLIVACISYFSILCPTYCNTFVLWTNSEFIRRQEKIEEAVCAFVFAQSEENKEIFIINQCSKSANNGEENEESRYVNRIKSYFFHHM